MVVELLASDVPERVYKLDSELEPWKRELGIGDAALPGARAAAADLSHPAMAVNLDACIQCTRCVRACREEQVNDVIGYAYRGAHSAIVFDLDDPMGASTCVACGECVQACPTGALAPARDAYLAPDRPHASSRCARTAASAASSPTTSRDNAIVRVEGRDGPANHERLCVKGRFGFDYVAHPQRLTKPLIRRDGVPKDPRRQPSTRRTRSPRSARRPGKRRWRAPSGALARIRDDASARARSPASARPRAATRRRTCSRSWCAPASARTTSTTARGCATRRAWSRCSRASARARCRTR